MMRRKIFMALLGAALPAYYRVLGKGMNQAICPEFLQ
jgi:hypothetical protein